VWISLQCTQLLIQHITYVIYNCNTLCTATHCNRLGWRWDWRCVGLLHSLLRGCFVITTCISSSADVYYNTLQHTAPGCNTLQHAAARCNTLQHTATHCNTLQRSLDRSNVDASLLQFTFQVVLVSVATHCNTRYHTATHCNILQLPGTQS